MGPYWGERQGEMKEVKSLYLHLEKKVISHLDKLHLYSI